METTHFDDKVTIECLKNGRKVEAAVLSFREEEFLTKIDEVKFDPSTIQEQIQELSNMIALFGQR